MRVLVTGVSTYWGGKVAQELEARPDVDVIVALDSREPRVPLERKFGTTGQKAQKLLVKTRQVADELGISVKTVEIHRGRVMEKMEVTSVAELVRTVLARRNAP